jgi:hypothetical protein
MTDSRDAYPGHVDASLDPSTSAVFGWVAAYAGLMTDAYPPFPARSGRHRPGSVPASSTPAALLIPAG